jgi:RHS repeat-associated protein
MSNEVDRSNNMKFQYYFFNGQRVARANSSNQVNWYFADHLGSSRVVWSLNGSDDSDYYPFGGERVISTGAGNQYKFTGKERDPESGNDYFGARYFASTMGRFLSPDWPAKAEPVPYAKLDDPQSLNLYSYVRNNPLSRVDADGHYELNASGCGDNFPAGVPDDEQ